MTNQAVATKAIVVHRDIMTKPLVRLFPFLVAVVAATARPARAQVSRPLMPIRLENSAEASWQKKPVHAARPLDDMTSSATWRFSGTGQLTFPPEPRRTGMRVLRVDMQMFVDKPAPTRNGLSSVNLQRAFQGEDWRGYNRISMWIRPEVSGFPMLPLQIVLHNDGAEKVPDVYNREGTHYVTLTNNTWQQVVWEIEPLARDRVAMLEFGYWVNKMLAAPSDRIAFEIGELELQRVDADHHTGWNVAPQKISFSHTGYQTGLSKTAVTSDSGASEFELLRVTNGVAGGVALRKRLQSVRGRLGEFRQADFSEVNAPGSYALRIGNTTSRPFRIAGDAWKTTIWETLNFFYGERCGFAVPGSHGVDHLDWFATHGDQRIVMSGGWHDAGDLSQGVINTGEATYAMFALAERLRDRGDDPALVARLLEEAKWGLDWVLRVRFDGGYRMAFASHNLWTNNISWRCGRPHTRSQEQPECELHRRGGGGDRVSRAPTARARAGRAQSPHCRRRLEVRDRRRRRAVDVAHPGVRGDARRACRNRYHGVSRAVSRDEEADVRGQGGRARASHPGVATARSRRPRVSAGRILLHRTGSRHTLHQFIAATIRRRSSR
jgi:hypothetical protein